MRCAIYTRKSTEEGLEQEFNTLQAQREAAEAYIASHRGEGWQVVPTRYDDGGWSGASLERPALQRLLHDVEERRMHCVVVYKVDRFSRSLLDFTRLLSLFEKRQVSFVSVTQVQHQQLHGSSDVAYPALVCAVRAGDHRRAHPRQVVCRAQKR